MRCAKSACGWVGERVCKWVMVGCVGGWKLSRAGERGERCRAINSAMRCARSAY